MAATAKPRIAIKIVASLLEKSKSGTYPFGQATVDNTAEPAARAPKEGFPAIQEIPEMVKPAKQNRAFSQWLKASASAPLHKAALLQRILKANNGSPW